MGVIFKTWQSRVTLILFLFFSSIWLYINYIDNSSILGQWFSNTYGLIALWGAIWGFIISREFGGIKSAFGKTLIFFSLGLLLQEFGQLAYSYYYYYLHAEIPYPSIGDIGYFGTIPMYCLALYYLGKSTGVSIKNLHAKNLAIAVLVPLAILSFTYIIFLNNYQFDWSSPLVVLLDFAYPLGNALYISMALSIYLLTKKVLGGIMKPRILLILFALSIQYVADFSFLYLTHNGTWIANGINDFFYLLSYTAMSLALIQFYIVLHRLKHS